MMCLRPPVLKLDGTQTGTERELELCASWNRTRVGNMSDGKRKQKPDQRDAKQRDQNKSAKTVKESKGESGKQKTGKQKTGKDKNGKKQPWYREGLRFECTQCGACCSG